MNAFRRIALIAFALLAVLIGAWLWSRRSLVEVEELEAQANQQVELSVREEEDYRPTRPARLDDLTADAEALLRGLPGVVKVTRSGPSHRPTVRIVHLCDMHIVPPEALGVQADSTAYRKHWHRSRWSPPSTSRC
jgi:hypothetical protein